MRKLKMDEKISIISYLVGMYELAGLDIYADVGRFPTSKDKNYDPEKLFISNCLGLNFDKDVYHNNEYTTYASNYIGTKKNENEVRKYMDELGKGWHIGDAITDVTATACIKAYKDNITITEDFVNELEREIGKRFAGFLKALSKAKGQQYKYVDSGVKYNDETLYKRIKNI